MTTRGSWNPETLFKHFEVVLAELRSHVDQLFVTLTGTMNQRFEASEAAARTALATAKQATDKAEEAMNRRLEGMNEFREQLKDQAATFVSRPEMCAAIESVAAAGNVHHKAVDERVDHLEQVVDTTTGKGQGLSMGWKALVGSLGLIITLLTIVILVIEFTGR